MGTIEVPEEITAEAARLVDHVLSSVPLKCAELRDSVVTMVAALLDMKPQQIRKWTPENLALRCVHLANYCHDKTVKENVDDGLSMVEATQAHFRTQAFARFFP